MRIDRRRKLPVTVLLKALGYESEELLEQFYNVDTVYYENGTFRIAFQPETFIGQRLESDLINPKDASIIGKKGRKISKALAKRIKEAGIETIAVDAASLLDRYFSKDIVTSIL